MHGDSDKKRKCLMQRTLEHGAHAKWFQVSSFVGSVCCVASSYFFHSFGFYIVHTVLTARVGSAKVCNNLAWNEWGGFFKGGLALFTFCAYCA